MNKIKLLLSLCLFSLMSEGIQAQNLKNSCDFYKATTYILTAAHAMDNFNESELDKTEAISIIEKDVSIINSSYEKLKKDYSNDADFGKFELWVKSIRKSLEMLIEDDPGYALGSAIIQIDIYEFLEK